MRSIDVPVLHLSKDRRKSIAATIRAVRRACDGDGAKAVVFGCTGMLGFADPVASELRLNSDCVIDPLPNAVSVARQAVEDADNVDGALYPAPEPKKIRGFSGWPALHDRMAVKP